MGPAPPRQRQNASVPSSPPSGSSVSTNPPSSATTTNTNNSVNSTQDNDDSAPSQSTCCICLTSKSSYACVPCGHKCLCREYSGNREIFRCPLCRANVSQV